MGDIYVCILQPQQQSVHFYDLAVQFYELYSIFVHFCDLYTGKEIYERQGLTNSILIKKNIGINGEWCKNKHSF